MQKSENIEEVKVLAGQFREVDLPFFLCSLFMYFYQENLPIKKHLSIAKTSKLIKRPSELLPGPVSRKSRELFGPEKPVIKLKCACLEKLIS